MNSFFRFLSISALCAFLASPIWAQDFSKGSVKDGNVEAELVADVAAIRPGQPFDVALRLKMDPHWHVYWTNPGDAGMAPTISWELPDGFEAGELRFPYPHQIPTPPYVSYGYEDEIFLLSAFTAPESVEIGSTAAIKASVDWLVCADVCIPGSARLALDLPVSASGESLAAAPFAEEIERARKLLPFTPARSGMFVEDIGETIVVTLRFSGLEGVELKEPHFFVEQESIANSAAKQSFDLSGDTLRVAISKAEYFDDSITEFSGLLYSADGFAAANGANAIRFSTAVSSLDIVNTVGEDKGSVVAKTTEITFLKALGFAFLGGMILNLMPCVFPVLSIKILGFTQQAGEDRSKILKHGLVFGAGVLLSFWVLAGVLIALRAGGEQLGWGFQLQSPYFVGALLIIMFVFGLSLAGVFEFGTSAISLASKVKSNGYGGSFFSGVLATAVATPCTGPFMGPALGFAMTLSAVQSLTVFTFLGLGMATPYVMLSAFPKWIEKLPRPGPWMETFKQLMSFPMFATCIWLVWLMLAHVGEDGVLAVLGGLLLISIGAWVYGRWAAPHRKAVTRKLGIAIGAVIAVGGIWVMLPTNANEVKASDVAAQTDKYGVVWESYSPELLASLRAEGKPVYVDFTAKWCLTCKANKLAVFSSDEVVDRLNAMGFTMLRGDWTKRNPVITEALESFGRSGVPLNVIYYGNDAEPVLLPELLNAGVVLGALEKLESI